MAKNTYENDAVAYSFGTDGSAALAGNPIYHQEEGPPQYRRGAHKNGRTVSHWLFYGAFLAVIVFLGILLLNAYGQRKAYTSELARMRNEIDVISQQTALLKTELEEAYDETRIRSLAVNRLGMQMPSQEQIVIVPAASPVTMVAESSAQTQEKMDFFRLLLSTLGF